MNLSATLCRRFSWINLPGAILVALLQRTPALNIVAALDEMVVSSPVGAVLRSVVASVAALGAVNSLAGATPLVPSAGSAAGVTVATGATVSVIYTITGTETQPMSWQITGSVPPGLDFSGLTRPGSVNVGALHLEGTPTMAGKYSLTIQAFEFTGTGGLGSPIYSYVITVTGSSATAPAITTQPASQTVTAGGSATFTAGASGSPAPTYQWQVSANSGSTWTNLTNTAPYSGTTTGTLTITGATISLDGRQYNCVASNGAPPNATSNAATLTVDVAPAFTTQPAGQTVAAGSNASFTAAASGKPAPTYQWQVSANSGSTWTNLTNTAPYSGTTTGTLTITGATISLNGRQYRCVAGNGVPPNANSSAATLTVDKAVPVITWTAPTAITFGTPLSATQLNATASVPGVLVYSPAAGTVLGAGAQTLHVTFTPNDTTDYTTATATRQLTVNKAVAVIAWPASGTIHPGTTLSSTQLNARASVPGAFVYTPAAGTVLSANTYTLKVTFTPTNTTDYATTTATQTLIVSSKTIPVITWPVPAAITYGTALSATQLNATASVPGTFVYTPAAGTVLNGGSQVLNVKFTPTDTTTYATTAGTQTLNVAKAAQTINFPAPGNKTYGSAPFKVGGSATSGQAVTFSVLSGPAKISWNTVILTGAGTVTIRASQAGNANYNAATPVDRSFAVAKAAQTISFGALGNKVLGAAPFILTGSATSGLALTYSVVSGPATIAGRTVTLTGAGTVTIQASQAGNANYNAATPVNRSFTVAGPLVAAKAVIATMVADTSSEGFLRRLFVDVLGRQITADELSRFSSAISGGEARAEVLGDLLGSAGYSRRQIDPAIRLYWAAFARVPDYTALQTCSNALQDGELTLTEAADRLAGDAEFLLRYGTLDNTQYVLQLSLNVLGHEADAASLAGWVDRLDAGASRGAVLAELSQSAEFKEHVADQVEILRLYFVLLRRIPTAAELQSRVDFLQGGDQTDLAVSDELDPEGLLDDYIALDEQMRDDLLADPTFTNGS